MHPGPRRQNQLPVTQVITVTLLRSREDNSQIIPASGSAYKVAAHSLPLPEAPQTPHMRRSKLKLNKCIIINFLCLVKKWSRCDIVTRSYVVVSGLTEHKLNDKTNLTMVNNIIVSSNAVVCTFPLPSESQPCIYFIPLAGECKFMVDFVVGSWFGKNLFPVSNWF